MDQLDCVVSKGTTHISLPVSLNSNYHRMPFKVIDNLGPFENGQVFANRAADTDEI